MGRSNAQIRASHRRRWRRWMKRITPEIRSLVINREIFEKVGRIVEANPRIQDPSDFHVWVTRNYVYQAAIGVRRMTDDSSDCWSLLRLLRDLRKHNKSLTRSSYLHWFRGGLTEVGDEQFDRLVGHGLAYMPTSMPEKDIARLLASGQAVKHFTDRRIAHLSKRRLRQRPPSIVQVNRAIETVESVFMRYHLLLTAKDMDGLLPVWMYDWTSVFREAWIPPREGD